MTITWMSPVMLWIGVPLATRWVLQQQKLIGALGVALNEEQKKDALLAGVKHPELVRIRVMKRVPLPLPTPWVLKSWLPDDVAGMALGYGIHLHHYWANSREVLVHELVHVGQYERLGGVRPFLREYLKECLIMGYPHGPLEREAIRKQREICKSSSSK